MSRLARVRGKSAIGSRRNASQLPLPATPGNLTHNSRFFFAFAGRGDGHIILFASGGPPFDERAGRSKRGSKPSRDRQGTVGTPGLPRPGSGARARVCPGGKNPPARLQPLHENRKRFSALVLAEDVVRTSQWYLAINLAPSRPPNWNFSVPCPCRGNTPR